MILQHETELLLPLGAYWDEDVRVIVKWEPADPIDIPPFDIVSAWIPWTGAHGNIMIDTSDWGTRRELAFELEAELRRQKRESYDD